MAKGEKASLLVFIACSLAMALTEGLGLALLVPILDFGQVQSSVANVPVVGKVASFFSAYPPDEKLRLVAAMLFVVLVLRAAVVYAANHLATSIPSRIFHRLSIRSFRALHGTTLRFSDAKSAGDLYNLVINAPERTTKVLKGVAQIIVMVPLVIVTVTLMLLLSWQITIFAVAFFLFLTVVVKGSFHTRSRTLGVQSSVAEVNLSQVAYDSFRLLAQTKLFGVEKHIAADFDRRLDEYVRCRIAVNRIASAITPFMTIGSGLAVVAILVGLSIASNDPSQEVSRLLILIAAMSRLPGPVAALSAARLQILANLDGFDRLETFLKETEIHREKEGNPAPEFFNEITFDHVSLTHPGRDKPAVNDISFSIARGEFIAVVGSSGAGKTTLVNLLTRIYDPDNGQVLVDGNSLREIDAAAWRRKIGVVSQDIALIAGSVEENIVFHREFVDSDAARRAAVLAAATSFIEDLPQNMQTFIGEGGKQLSGGQKQRIAIARTMAAGSQLLVMDEATSGLDSTSEREIRAALADLKGKVTVVAITHRLYTILNADKILVLGNGALLDCGTDEELVARCAEYRDLRATAAEPVLSDPVDERAEA